MADVSQPFDYDRAAADYDRHRAGAGPYFDAFVRHARNVPATRVLELGAGTGNETAAFLEACPCRLTALERSAGMIARGRAKGLPVRWVRGDATAMAFAGGSFDFVFASYVIHHIRDIGRLARECRRVLARGCVALITVPEGFIRNHPLNAYFPSVATVDGARFQPVEDVVDALRAAGFSRVGQDHCTGPPRCVDEYYAERIANRFISTYDLIPPDELQTGLERLRRDIARDAAPVIAREATVVWGYV